MIHLTASALPIKLPNISVVSNPVASSNAS